MPSFKKNTGYSLGKKKTVKKVSKAKPKPKPTSGKDPHKY